MVFLTSLDLDYLPSFYLQAYDECMDKIIGTEDLNIKLKLYDEFSEVYTMIPRMWINVFEIIKQLNSDKDIIEFYSNKALSHFYSEDFYPFLMLKVLPFSRNLGFKDEIRLSKHAFSFFMSKTNEIEIKDQCRRLVEEALNFPHESLDRLYLKYIQTFGDQLNGEQKRSLKAAKLIYKKIMASYSNVEEWFNFIKLTNDREFIYQTCECRIALNPGNKQLWLLYIKYLQKNSDIWVLTVFSRYCRFFIEDKSNLEEYRKSIEFFALQKSPIAKWWIDTIKFEKIFGSGKSSNNDYVLILLIKRAWKSINNDQQQPSKMFMDFIRNENYFELLKNFLPDENLDSEISPEIPWESLFPYPFLIKKESINYDYPSLLCDYDFPNEKPSKYNFPERKSKPKIFYVQNDLNYLIPTTKQHFSLSQSYIDYIGKAHTSFLGTKKLYETCKYFFNYRKELLCDNLDMNKLISKWKNEKLSLQTPFNNEFYINNIKKLWLHGILKLSYFTSNDINLLNSKITYFNPIIISIRSIPYDLSFEDLRILSSNSKALKYFSSSEANYYRTDLTKAKMNEILDLFLNISKFVYSNKNGKIEKDELINVNREKKLNHLIFSNLRHRIDPENFCQFIKDSCLPRSLISIRFFPKPVKQNYFNILKATVISFLESLPLIGDKPHFNISIKSSSNVYQSF